MRVPVDVLSVPPSDPSAFDQGLTGAVDGSKPPADGPNARHLRQQARLHQTGAALASKALAYGTLYACAGCAALFFALWKLSGAEDLQDFRRRAGTVLPVIPKNNPPQGRTEFSGINDFLTYVVEEDEKKKAQKRLEKDKQN